MAVSAERSIYARIAGALAACSFLPGSWDKRFVRNMDGIARCSPEIDFSERQRINLIRLAHKYRRQLSTAIAIAAQDEAEAAANRRVSSGLPALADFSPSRRVKKRRVLIQAQTTQGVLL